MIFSSIIKMLKGTNFQTLSSEGKNHSVHLFILQEYLKTYFIKIMKHGAGLKAHFVQTLQLFLKNY